MIYIIPMIVYVEYVIFDNFLLDLFIGILICKLLRFKSWRSFVSAIIGTVLALIYPCVTDKYVALFKILTLLCCCLPFICGNLASFVKSVFCYCVIAFIFNGLISLVIGSKSDNNNYSDGGLVGIISGCALIGYLVVYKFINILVNRISNEKFVKLKVVVGEKSLKAVGFVDSGNIATASNGKGIVFLDKVISKKIHSDPVDYVYINTISAKKICNVIKIDKLMIYFDGKEHIYTDVNAVKTNQTYQGFQVLLSSNLEEVRV